MRLRAFLATFVVMWLVPIPVYGVFAAAWWMQMPEAAGPAAFYLGVSLIKAAFAAAFVALFPGDGRWGRFALTWWGMFAALEVGQVLAQGHALSFAVAGILFEAAYFPLSALWVARILHAAPVPYRV